MSNTVGRYTYGENRIKIYNYGEKANLHIGSFCSIGSNCEVYVGGNHHTDYITTYPFGHMNTHVFNSIKGKDYPASKTKGDVRIGNDVWIGANVVIMSGVNIGDGAVIANNSHVVKNVEPYTIVGGNPAKHIKFRFTKEQTEALLQIQWWNWEVGKINDNLKLLCNDNIDEFINKFYTHTNTTNTTNNTTTTS